MSQQFVIDTASLAILTAMKVASPALLAILVTGLIVSIFQAATQINEQILSFIPKIIAMTAAIIIAGPWIIKTMIFFTENIIRQIPKIMY